MAKLKTIEEIERELQRADPDRCEFDYGWCRVVRVGVGVCDKGSVDDASVPEAKPMSDSDLWEQI